MKADKISFLTPLSKIIDKQIVLEKKYSYNYQLTDGSYIYLSSDIGNPKTQQDSIAVAKNNDYLLLLVSDGMGGLSNGEIASYTTAKIIKKWLESEYKECLKELNKHTLNDVLTALIYLISERIPEKSGATLNMSIIGPENTLIANIGDSRTYTIKDNQMTLRTEDDSQAFMLFNPKTEEERDRLRFYKHNNLITNAITKDIFPTIKITTIKNEDYDIICHLTDGITDILPESLINKFSHNPNPSLSLVASSCKPMVIFNPINQPDFNNNLTPGKDNATAIVYTKKYKRNN